MSKIVKQTISSKNLYLTIVLNLVITITQVIGGIISGSLALISDALHNFTDVLSLIFSLFAHQMSKKKASINHTFGFKRAEIMAAFINAFLLILIAFFLILKAIEKLHTPVVISSNLVIALSLLGIFVNGLSAFLLKKDANKNLNMESAYLHLFSDMMASVVVLIGGIMMKFYQFYWIDSLLTILIALYLIIVGVKLLIKSSKFLMLFTPKDIDIKEIVREIHKIPNVNKLHHIHVWNLNEDELHLEAHLDCIDNITLLEFNVLLEQIENILFQKFGINHVNIQPLYQKEDSKNY
ncbi:MAG: cation diffusion facilitator family transporter, partial [Flavobacterium sp.]